MFYNNRLEELRAELNRLVEKRQMEEYYLQQAQMEVENIERRIGQLDMEITEVESEIIEIDSVGFGVENSGFQDWEADDDY